MLTVTVCDASCDAVNVQVLAFAALFCMLGWRLLPEAKPILLLDRAQAPTKSLARRSATPIQAQTTQAASVMTSLRSVKQVVCMQTFTAV